MHTLVLETRGLRMGGCLRLVNSTTACLAVVGLNGDDKGRHMGRLRTKGTGWCHKLIIDHGK